LPFDSRFSRCAVSFVCLAYIKVGVQYLNHSILIKMIDFSYCIDQNCLSYHIQETKLELNKLGESIDIMRTTKTSNGGLSNLKGFVRQ
jgi:hypothetical protein